MGDHPCEKCSREFDSPQALAGHSAGCGSKPWDKPNLLERLYWDEGMSLAEIADRWDDASGESIQWQMKKHSIERRSTGEGKRLQHAADVYVSEVRGRMRLEFREFGEHRQFPLSRLLAMVEYPLDELGGHHVHHKNGGSLDDRLENLEVLEPSEHHRGHAPDEIPQMPAERRRKLVEQRERDEQGRFV